MELQRTTILPGSGAGGSLDGSAATIHLDSGHDSSGASLYLDSTLQKATQGLESLRMRSTALQHKQSEHQVRTLWRSAPCRSRPSDVDLVWAVQTKLAVAKAKAAQESKGDLSLSGGTEVGGGSDGSSTASDDAGVPVAHSKARTPGEAAAPAGKEATKKRRGTGGVEFTGAGHGRPGAWDRMQSDNHAQSLLPSQVQQELQRVLWSAIKSRKRTLFGHKVNDLKALFHAVRAPTT